LAALLRNSNIKTGIDLLTTGERQLLVQHRLFSVNVVPVSPPSAKSTAKVPPFSMRGVPGNGGKSKRRLKTTPVLG
jgi:hypothetical protein